MNTLIVQIITRRMIRVPWLQEVSASALCKPFIINKP
jgi:hypothetical protein